MDTDLRILSPARRSRRCVLSLCITCVLAIGAYVSIYPGQRPFGWAGSAVTTAHATPDRHSSSASTTATTRDNDQPTAAPVQLTIAGKIPSETLPVKGH